MSKTVRRRAGGIEFDLEPVCHAEKIKRKKAPRPVRLGGQDGRRRYNNGSASQNSQLQEEQLAFSCGRTKSNEVKQPEVERHAKATPPAVEEQAARFGETARATRARKCVAYLATAPDVIRTV